MTARKKAVSDGRAMVRVKCKSDGTILTAALCPGCWNERRRREALLKEMARRDVEVISAEDGINGVYLSGKTHLHDCPHRP